MMNRIFLFLQREYNKVSKAFLINIIVFCLLFFPCSYFTFICEADMCEKIIALFCIWFFSSCFGFYVGFLLYLNDNYYNGNNQQIISAYESLVELKKNYEIKKPDYSLLNLMIRVLKLRISFMVDKYYDI